MLLVGLGSSHETGNSLTETSRSTARSAEARGAPKTASKRPCAMAHSLVAVRSRACPALRHMKLFASAIRGASDSGDQTIALQGENVSPKGGAVHHQVLGEIVDSHRP